MAQNLRKFILQTNQKRAVFINNPYNKGFIESAL